MRFKSYWFFLFPYAYFLPFKFSMLWQTLRNSFRLASKSLNGNWIPVELRSSSATKQWIWSVWLRVEKQMHSFIAWFTSPGLDHDMSAGLSVIHTVFPCLSFSSAPESHQRARRLVHCMLHHEPNYQADVTVCQLSVLLQTFHFVPHPFKYKVGYNLQIKFLDKCEGNYIVF